MIKAGKRIAIYSRVSTKDKGQTTAAQQARNAGCSVEVVYEDKGISGAKGRDKRPQFDALLKAGVRREFDMIAVWSSDRLGRSLTHLVEVLETIKATGVGLYIHTQALDTSTPSGRAMVGMLGVFAEFEREMIKERVTSGMARAREEMERKGFYTTKKGTTIKRFGRPGAEAHKIKGAKKYLADGMGILKAAKLSGLGTSTVHRLKREMVGGR
jgi:DNA invertase Pin-like site-specific DNA recombinase